MKLKSVENNATGRRKRFSPGQPVLVREIWQGRVWSARPEIIVQDAAELLALYICPGTILKDPRTPDGTRPTPESRAKNQWQLVDYPWVGQIGRLRLTIPGEPYSVLIFWNDDRTQRAWYINFEDPLTRTRRGFDYMDQLLNIVLEPDPKTWYWKDEDELKEATRLGLISPDRAEAMRTEGKKVVKMLQSGESIFNDWENWRPDPSWQVSTLPEAWDIV